MMRKQSRHEEAVGRADEAAALNGGTEEVKITIAESTWGATIHTEMDNRVKMRMTRKPKQNTSEHT